ncbi:unnamed protein product [Heterobilharzia americana]|nr:unnamed protein product [Heterobilharzia americana]
MRINVCQQNTSRNVIKLHPRALNGPRITNISDALTTICGTGFSLKIINGNHPHLQTQRRKQTTYSSIPHVGDDQNDKDNGGSQDIVQNESTQPHSTVLLANAATPGDTAVINDVTALVNTSSEWNDRRLTEDNINDNNDDNFSWSV